MEELCKMAISKDESREKRPLTKYEKEAAIRVFSKFFFDERKEVEAFLDELMVTPISFYGKVFFTYPTLTFCEAALAQRPERLQEMYADYLHNLLGMDKEDAWEYMESIKARKIVICGAASEGKAENYFVDFNVEDLQNARREMNRAEQLWDDALDRCMPYSREPNNECKMLEEEYYQAEKTCRIIETYFEKGIDKTPVRSAIQEYYLHYQAENEKIKN